MSNTVKQIALSEEKQYICIQTVIINLECAETNYSCEMDENSMGNGISEIQY